MRLARTTELILVLGVILYTVFLPGSGWIRRVLQSPLGLSLGLGGLYWIARTVSGPLALIVLVALARASSAVFREHMSTDCGCADPSFSYDSGLKQCTKKEGDKTQTMSPTCCALGLIWDALQSKCTTPPGKEGGVMRPPMGENLSPQ